MLNKLLLIYIVFSVSFPSLPMELFNDNEYCYDGSFDLDSLFGDDLNWAAPTDSTLLTFSSEIKYSGDIEREQPCANTESEQEPVLKKFKAASPEDGEKQIEIFTPLNSTPSVHIFNNYYSNFYDNYNYNYLYTNNYYDYNYFYNSYFESKINALAANEPTSPEKIDTQNDNMPERKRKMTAGIAQDIRETQKVSIEKEKNHAGLRKKEYKFTASRCPVLWAMLSCVKDKIGASFIEERQKIDVKNLGDLFKCIKKRCNKPRPTRDWVNRLKSVQKHFLGFPERPFGSQFELAPIKPDDYNKILDEVYEGKV